MRNLLNKHGSKVFSILCRPSRSVLGILRSLLLLFHLFPLLHAGFLILNWFELLLFFMDDLRILWLLLLAGSSLVFLRRGLMLSLGLVMSCVALVMRLLGFLFSDILLTITVGTLDLFAFSIVAHNLITRFNSLGVHLTVGAHL